MRAPESLGQVLVEIGLITEPQLAELEISRRASSRRLTEEVVAAAIVTEERLVSELGRYLEMEIVDPARTPIHERVLSVVPAEVAHKHRVLPMARTKEGDVECLFVVTSDPFDDMAAGVLGDLLPEGTAVRYVLAGDTQLAGALQEHYGAEPRVDTVSAPAPRVVRDDTGGVRLGGSAAMPLSRSMIPEDDEATKIEDTTPTVRTTSEQQQQPPPPSPPKKKRLTTKKPEPKDDSQIGNYSLKKRIGVSGVAETWEATVVNGPVPGRRVNVRRMLPSLPRNAKTRKNFFGAAQRMVGVDSPNLVTVLEADSADGKDYVVTENVEGIDLLRALTAASNKRKVIPVPFALRIIRGVLAALQAAHEADVCHEHLSPRTVLIAKDGVVRVVDFGVAPTLMEERGRYVAPEQSDGEADERTDLFRAGAILYELLSGAPLVDASVKDHGVAIDAIRGFRRTLAERREGIDPELESLLDVMLHVMPGRRPSTAEACLVEVDALIERLGSAASDAGLWRYVEDLVHAPPEDENPSGISEAAAVASGRVIELAGRAQDRAAPLLEDAGDRAAAGFERLMAAPAGVKVAIGIGAFLVVVVASAIVAAVLSTGESETTPVVVAGEEPPSRVDEEPALVPPRNPRPPKRPVPKRVEVFDGVLDGPAPEGSKYVRTHGVELRAVAGEDDPEVLLWLEVGQTVREIADVDGEKLVMIPPRGPAGFVGSNDLTTELPLAALARAAAFTKCRVDRRRSLDDCLYDAKQQHDACLDKCQGREGTRCKPACDLAFESCLGACRESQEVADERPRRRRRRRR